MMRRAPIVPFLALALAATARAAGADPPAVDRSLTPEGIVHEWVAAIRPERFESQAQMTFAYSYKYPEFLPQIPMKGSTCWVLRSTAQRRFEIKYVPVRADMEASHDYVAVWGGESGAQRYLDMVTVSRLSPKDDDPYNTNAYLNWLGLPALNEQKKEAAKGIHWLPDAVSSRKGYKIKDALEVVDGVPYHVIVGDHETLWFDHRDGVRLIKRDVWQMKNGLAGREVFNVWDYKKDGLPRKARVTKYLAVDAMGEPSRIMFQIDLTVTKLLFESPPETVFAIDIKPGLKLYDDRTQARYIVAAPGEEPFSEVMNLAGPRMPRSGGISTVLWVNLLAVSVLLLVWGIRLRRRWTLPARADEGLGSP
jgi:hypothetical protein